MITILLPLIPLYLLTVRLLRFSRINRLHREYAARHGLASSPPLRRERDKAPTRKELPMTPAEAQKILLEGVLLEMPWILPKALEFALFKSNDDMLYTLSTFILEPGVWAKEFEWRPLTPVEEMAWHVFFSEVGRRMGIENIPDELEDLTVWAEEYEKAHMVPEEACRDVASGTTRLLLHNVPRRPRWLIRFGEQVVACLLYDRLREAIMLPPPPRLLKSLVVSSLHFRAFLIRHFFLPRWKATTFLPIHAPAFPKGYVPVSEPSSKSDKGASEKGDGSNNGEKLKPRTHILFYNNEAWYTAIPRGPASLLQSFLLLTGLKRVDQVPGPAYKPEGFRLEECGPTMYEGKGEEEVRRIAERIHGGVLEGPYAVGGVEKGRCPFGL
ncbi:hypothetical protein MNV49_000814 [Pseudohyphozyma bogoriensis]|nr:hypothetical protein MNV49_000814 [Pseudohyphozyma bogoriensis]